MTIDKIDIEATLKKVNVLLSEEKGRVGVTLQKVDYPYNNVENYFAEQLQIPPE